MPALERENAAVRVLILGGTGEAVSLAEALPARFGDRVAVITSLAGRTTAPAAVAGAMRFGGFGGGAGFAAYLAAERIALVIDATHPFAAQISTQAAEACAKAAVPRLVLERLPWRKHPGDRWIEAEDAAAAAAVLPSLGSRTFLTIGTRALSAFAALAHMHFLVRLVEAPRAALPLAACELVLGRGPFVLAEERALIERHRIDVLVTKASGGAATEAKLVAARELGLPVLMIRRPPPPPGPRVTGIAAALDWVAACLLVEEARS